jgi:hypothetical protein
MGASSAHLRVRTTTSTLHGLLRDDRRSRQELFALTGANR